MGKVLLVMGHAKRVAKAVIFITKPLMGGKNVSKQMPAFKAIPCISLEAVELHYLTLHSALNYVSLASKNTLSLSKYQLAVPFYQKHPVWKDIALIRIL